MKYIENDLTDCPNQHENNQNLYGTKGYPHLYLLKVNKY